MAEATRGSKRGSTQSVAADSIEASLTELQALNFAMAEHITPGDTVVDTLSTAMMTRLGELPEKINRARESDDDPDDESDDDLA